MIPRIVATHEDVTIWTDDNGTYVIDAVRSLASPMVTIVGRSKHASAFGTNENVTSRIGREATYGIVGETVNHSLP
jgi:hypothetical protein